MLGIIRIMYLYGSECATNIVGWSGWAGPNLGRGNRLFAMTGGVTGNVISRDTFLAVLASESKAIELCANVHSVILLNKLLSVRPAYPGHDVAM